MPDRCHEWTEEEIEQQILSYLEDHPDAKDSLDGIVHWWLMERVIKFQTQLVQEALISLVKKGLVYEHKMSNAEPLYGLVMKAEGDFS